jgi:hypothetical protein
MYAVFGCCPVLHLTFRDGLVSGQQCRRAFAPNAKMDSSQCVHFDCGCRLLTAFYARKVEVRVSPRTTARFDSISNSVLSYITSSFDRISLPSTLEGWEDDSDLASSVERIVASESSCPFSSLSLEEMLLQIHIYQPCDSDFFEEFSNDGGGGADGEEVMAATVCELPNRNWEGLWDSLVYADNIKLKLLDYIHATFVLSDANVDCGWFSPNQRLNSHLSLQLT